MAAPTPPAAAKPQHLLFTPITESLIRKRAEHNEGMVSTLEEVALHQQNIGKIELLGQLCPKLKILYLQNNLISKLQNLHKLKELQYLNMAVNNLTKVENLQRCESLSKLDLTVNFIGKAGLLTVASLRVNHQLKELTLMGNPCTEWSGYRPYVIAQLPDLKRLDGQDIKPSERIAAQQLLPELIAQLHADLVKDGIDPAQAAEVEDDSLMFDESGEVRETGTVDEATGELRRPWCPATRILDHIENERANREAEARKASSSAQRLGDLDTAQRRPDRLDDFPEVNEGDRIMQRNEGQWDFSLEEADVGPAGSGARRRVLVLEVDVGRYLDTSLIKADVQPTYIRLLIKGRLLQLLLPCEVLPDASQAQRSQATGRLVITLPKAQPDAQPDITLIRPKQHQQGQTAPAPTVSDAGVIKPANKPAAAAPAKGGKQVMGSGRPGEFVIREARRAVVTACEGDDDDDFVPAIPSS